VPTNPEQRDKPNLGPKPPPADAQPAVEEDHDQREHGDPLDVLDRELATETRNEMHRQRGCEQEDRRRRHRDPLAQLVREDRKGEDRRDDEHDQAEMCDLAHWRRA
jgi:hypothetical protein